MNDNDALALLSRTTDDLLVEFGRQLVGMTAEAVRDVGDDAKANLLGRLRQRALDWFQIHAGMVRQAAQDNAVVMALHSGQGTALTALAALLIGHELSEQPALTAAALILKLGVEVLCQEQDPFADVASRKPGIKA
ncbi:MAG: hypothetical protein FWF75_07020 [Propionibacteriaceae bacterium]|nr:hypothetical protein [Propionibacteriaceae bacterium]